MCEVILRIWIVSSSFQVDLANLQKKKDEEKVRIVLRSSIRFLLHGIFHFF